MRNQFTRGTRTRSPRDAVGGILPLALLLLAGCGGGGGGGGGPAPGTSNLAALQAAVERGDPELAPAAGIAGSGACIACHAATFAEHERTAHHRGLRSTDRPGVDGVRVHANLAGSGKDDFRRGLDLRTRPAFAAFGASAPRLLYDGGAERPYAVAMGGATFPVERVYGGRRREDYLLRAGDALFLAPFEFDLEAREYRALETATWYDGTVPRFASAEAAASGLEAAASFERRCAGCHHTGFNVDFDGGSGRWRTGYAEVGIGCESCHGPSATHVLSDGNPAFTRNPRALDDGTAEGRRRANAVCTQCHDRGHGATLPGAPAPVEYPWTAAGPFAVGDTLDGALVRTSDPADFHGRRDNPLSSTPTPLDPTDDTFVAARSGWMQGVEHETGGHSPDRDGAPLCFDCHDPHGRKAPAQLVTRFPRDRTVRVSDRDGTLCLACHAGSAPFATLSRSDVADFARGGRPAVRDAVVRHMADGGMPVAASAYDPEGTGVGRCSACHMAETGTGTRATTTDAAGFPASTAGGGSHTMRTLWPSVSEAHDVTNGCNRCHGDATTDGGGSRLAQWRVDGADGDGVFHGAAARRFQTGNLGAASGTGPACVRCHTTEGFRRIAVEGDPDGLTTDAAARAGVIADAVRFEEGVTCAACHGPDGDGVLADGRAPLRLPREQLCTSCHGDGVDFDDYLFASQSPHAPQGDLFTGGGGVEPPGSGSYVDGFHTTVADGCVHCHLDRRDPLYARHTFEPDVRTCGQCHPSPDGFNLIAFGDYDGDGTVEGLQDEVRDLVALVRDAVLAADLQVVFDGKKFKRGAGPAMTGAGAPLQRAAFNVETVLTDRSGGIHNPTRIVRLLQKSYAEVTGNDVPGATLR